MEYDCRILSLAEDFKDKVERTFKLFYNDKLPVLYSNNNRSSVKSKHIDIKLLIVKERVKSSLVSVQHIGTNFMVVDRLTMELSFKIFHRYILIWCHVIWEYSVLVRVYNLLNVVFILTLGVYIDRVGFDFLNINKIIFVGFLNL